MWPLLVLMSILGTWGEDLCTNECFHAGEDSCPRYDSSDKCKQSNTCPNAIVCCHLHTPEDANILLDNNTTRLFTNIESAKIHLRNVTIESFNLLWLRRLKVSSLAITDGSINEITGEFSKQWKSICLNFSSNGIREFQNTSLKHVQTLKILDLSHNNLTQIPPLRLAKVTLDISDNKPLECTNIGNITRKYEIYFKNLNTTTCWSAKMFPWFNTTSYISLLQLDQYAKIKTNCTLKNCSCVIESIDYPDPKMVMKIDCSGRQLTSLPSPLPANAIALNISNNNITSLDLISEDPSYGNLRELYADHNKITSIVPLLNSHKFISTFWVLTLRNNKFNTVPTYVLSNIFDRNEYFRYLSLGQNRLECNCNIAKVLKVWLLNKAKLIPDYDEIFCDNMDLRVIDLDATKLCKTEQDWTDYIYYIIIIEILLLLLLIGKVSYDYWIFKTAGYLPWPASKMPKLPCDWLCE